MRGSAFRSDDLRSYMLGNSYGAIGLLHKVEQMVLKQEGIGGPTFQTGSVMQTKFTVTDSDRGNESGISETCFALLVALTQWLGKGIGWDKSGETERGMLRYLIKNRITDIEVLTGGRFDQVTAELERILPDDDRVFTPDDAVWQRVNELKVFLLKWLEDDCDHDWELIADVDQSMRIATFRCRNPRCGANKYLYNGDENQWAAV